MKFFHTPDDVLRHLDGLGFFHMDFSLGRMESALRRLDMSRPPFRIIQVLGTNGKGSTSTFLAALAREHGISTGLCTSPHFLSPAERIVIDGVPSDMAGWPDPAGKVLSAGPDLTYFEFLTVLAVLLFARAGVRLVVMEAGLGGRFDATTALPADVMCYVPMAMDHRDVLGHTLEAVARDKCAAVRSSAPVVSAPQFPAAERVLRDAAAHAGAPLVMAPPLPEGISPGMMGPHQRVNAAAALAAWRAVAPMLDAAPDAAAEARALAAAAIPGRLQRLSGARLDDGTALPPLLLDGAHNPHGMRALDAALEAEGIRPRAAVWSCLGDKDWRPAAAILRRRMHGLPIIVPGLHNERAAGLEEMIAFLRGSDGGSGMCDAHPAADAASALRRCADVPPAPGDGPSPVVVCGSLYLLSEIYALNPAWLEAGRRAEGFGEAGLS